jgi:hypothetical protein
MNTLKEHTSPAIVKSVDFADRIHALLHEAQGFGRKTIEQKVACGRKLLDAHMEWESREKPPPWKKYLQRFGFTEPTARRLMTAAKAESVKMTLQLLKSQPFDADAIYDDGIDPEVSALKKPCRECRMSGRLFNQKCAACRAFNRVVKPAKDPNEPVMDMDGNLVPEHLIEVFQEGWVIRELTGYLATATKALKGLVERPGCAALNVAEMQKRLRSLGAYAWKYRPGLPCPECQGQKCEQCRQRGFRTVMEVMDERAAESNAKNREKAKQWRARQAARSEPIPE